MTPRDNSYYDLIKYGFANETYQEFVDNYLSTLHNGRKTDGFEWDSDIQIDFTYHQIQAELGLNTMPTYVDIDSPAVYKHHEGFELSSGTIPRAKHGYALNEKILREEMIFAQRTGRFSTNLSQKMRDLAFDHTSKLIGGNYNGLTYQRDRMVSTGTFTLNAANNPSGIKDITFGAKIPDTNRTILTTTARWFTNDTNAEGATSDPIRNLKDQVYNLKKKGVAAMHFEVDYLTFRRAIEHSKIRTAIALNIYPLADANNIAPLAAVLDESVVKTKLEGIIGCAIKVIDNIVAVEKFDKVAGKVVKDQIRSFEPNVWVLVPDGKLGTIKAVEPIVVPDPAARFAWFDGGRTVLKQWYDTRTNTQYIESELTALVVPDKPQYMTYLTVA
ncbi:major capsid protein E [Dysgonomonas alginatilytica]|uniref:Major capsid protein E n=1 Tax=Dysgonomonas alginatilytica TaxID=1605892 RepID=A0A2V3PNC1_9BACT|nr:major capsid protein [Dysgonomonas alginatilytica]PXV62373.1 major capsid protein E [Dysgonomonas alginatilytica]